MKTSKNYLPLSFFLLVIASCGKDNPVANNITLHFDNTFSSTTIVLGDATSSTATVNTSADGQLHHFSELKYVISNIRLIKADGSEIPYNINDLDNGATVVDHSKPQTLDYILSNIPAGEYRQLKFGLGVRPELNTLDEARFPDFYAKAGANDTQMHWEWGTGYRFTKIEGFYDTDNKQLSIHTGSTVEGTNGEPDTYTQGVDAYRDITLTLPDNAVVGSNAPKITIKADFDKLLSGKTNTITLGEGNATPSTHAAVNMVLFVDNLGGDGSSDISGMFSTGSVEN
ncbi:MbnP family protein [Olivibacter sitiensis]|uniref:MbnP family protein n=1 Tax=Olivibacter sitiensis TaxID=376470 RepID=UPI0003FF2337|nr:MbnP family protein [Olivibacter sitiensis]